MTKAELIERIIDRITDPWTESCEDYENAELIDLDVAKDIIAQCREEDPDLDPEDRLPEECTPEMMMIAFNCNVRKNWHELRVQRLAEWITENDCVCEYVNYYLPTLENGIDIMPTEFIADTDGCPFLKEEPSPLDLICIGMNSRETFDPQDEYCWYDADTFTIHSTNEPFRDGTLDAEAFARFVLLDAEAFDYMFDGVIDGVDIPYILGCTKEEYINKEVM